jgi:hypothetical protein
MAEALRSPTRFKDLEEHEIIPELVVWLRERAFMEQVNAESLAESVASTMKTSSFSDEWLTVATTQIDQSQDQVTLEAVEEDSDLDIPTAASSTTDRVAGQHLLVNTAGKQGATLHNTGNCWMARSRSFTSLELRSTKPEEGEYQRICKLCWPRNPLVQEQESSSSESESEPGQLPSDDEGQDSDDLELNMIELPEAPINVEDWEHHQS